jgi:hypothetical protein
VYFTPVALLTAVMAAAGTAAPELSATVPTIMLSVVWANSIVAKRRDAATSNTVDLTLEFTAFI